MVSRAEKFLAFRPRQGCASADGAYMPNIAADVACRACGSSRLTLAKIQTPNAKGACFMSQLVSLPPVSPGIVYAVRKLLEYAPESESDARKLCSELWPKMDSDAVQTVMVYWHVQTESENAPSSSVIVTRVRARVD
jgi:hypothetical protein